MFVYTRKGFYVNVDCIETIRVLDGGDLEIDVRVTLSDGDVAMRTYGVDGDDSSVKNLWGHDEHDS